MNKHAKRLKLTNNFYIVLMNLAGPDSKPKKVSFFRRLSRAAKEPEQRRAVMQQQSMEMALRELTHPAHNEQLKNQQQVTFKLVKTGKFN